RGFGAGGYRKGHAIQGQGCAACYADTRAGRVGQTALRAFHNSLKRLNVTIHELGRAFNSVSRPQRAWARHPGKVGKWKPAAERPKNRPRRGNCQLAEHFAPACPLFCDLKGGRRGRHRKKTAPRALSGESNLAGTTETKGAI